MENEKDIAPINGDLNVVNNEVEIIKQKIYKIRGKQVMLDSDVAEKYQYTTKNINKAMKRNIERFPEDFCFQLTEDEFQNLRFHFGTLNKKVNNGEVTRKYLPYGYTEQGIAMLSGMLKNEIAVQVSINIMRAFVEMRKHLVNNQLMLEKINSIELNQLEYKITTDERLSQYDKKFEILFKEFNKYDFNVSTPILLYVDVSTIVIPKSLYVEIMFSSSFVFKSHLFKQIIAGIHKPKKLFVTTNVIFNDSNLEIFN